jgi:hypothetical protein
VNVSDSLRPNLIIQAGGRGTRLGRLTANKPKALVPVHGKPMLFHTLDMLPHADAVVIGDYGIDVLRRYLEAFGADRCCEIVTADGVGTCAGVAEAARRLQPDVPVILSWCDLVYSDSPVELFAGLTRPAIGLAGSFPCRWSFTGGQILHAPSTTDGIAGCFWFPQTALLYDVPPNGEFCQYLSSLPGLDAVGVTIGDRCREVGTIEAHERLTSGDFACRPFNRIRRLGGGSIVKEPIDPQGESLARLEQAWYRQASSLGLGCLPRILGYDPLCMEEVDGQEPFLLRSSEKTLRSIIDGLHELHDACPPVRADADSLDVAYLKKTADRLAKVKALVPFADLPELMINGRTCPNPLTHWDELSYMVRSHYPDRFHFIHGDPTFSNMLVSPERVVFIDPRGYFGTTDLFGDVAYDWAKLLYSVMTNYDQFNLGRFSLSIMPDGVELEIASNGWEELASQVVQASGVPQPYLMTILGIIWMSLTTYAWDDYDKICGAFYKGTEVLSSLWA